MKLSDFKDDEAFEVVGKLFVPISQIATTLREMAKEKSCSTMAEYAQGMLQQCPQEMKEIFAILNRQDVEDYHPTAATLFADILSMLSDKELLRLFGVQGQTQAVSGSAMESTTA
jgi:hypothetical protein